MGGTIFGYQDARDTLKLYFKNIEEEIQKNGVKYFLEIDHEEYLNYLYNLFEFKPLSINRIDATIKYKGIHTPINNGVNGTPYYAFVLRVPFEGNSFLLHLKPSISENSTFYATVLSENINGIIEYGINLENEDPDKYRAAQKNFLDFLERNLPHINDDAKWFNVQIKPYGRKIIQDLISKHSKRESFLKEIGIEISQDTKKVFQIPKLSQPVIIAPARPENKQSNQLITPTVSTEFFDDVTDIINRVYRSVEKKPSIFKSKNEEELRDYVLPMLETRYDYVTATGETFNKKGKTDILLRYTDGTNLFIAECKYWHGKKQAQDAIGQLFEGYLTWRDSKVSLIFFVREKNFTDIIRKANEAIQQHEYFIKFNDQLDESTFNYDMHIPGDKEKIVKTRLMLFAFSE